ncbi:MAG: GDP-mannose 4,6-dehydratase [Bdellovibrionota bacterium]
MKLLVTGAGGFIGSHVVEACVAEGHDVRAFVRYNSRNSWGWLEGSSALKKIEVRSGDIRDYDSVLGALKGCDGVLHLAALIGIPYSYESPLAYVRTNVEGTYNVLQGARELGLKQVLVTSTSETYGTAQRVPIDELHPAVGQSPYSASKIAADQLAISYHRSFGVPVKIVRPFNTFGPRQSARAIIPTIITQILAGKKEIKLGNLSPTRDLTFVKDTAAAFLAILRSDKLVGEAANIGMGEEISVGDLALKIAALLKTKVKIVADKQRVRPGASEVERLLSDPSKLKKPAKWKPAYDLDRGLVETIEFLKAHQHLYKADLYNV